MRRRDFFAKLAILAATPIAISKAIAEPELNVQEIDENWVRWRIFADPDPSNSDLDKPLKFSYIEFEVPMTLTNWEVIITDEWYRFCGSFDFDPNRFKPNKFQRKIIKRELKSNPNITAKQLSALIK